ncbi:MAG: hypothetical protein ABIO72_05710 [Patescibacteria group bacterium]
MRRAATILLGILLGALAAGLGIGFFLMKANTDRARLADEVAATVAEATQARDENTKAIQAANTKLNASNTEVAKAQALIKSLQEERDQIAHATALVPPPPKAIRGWQDAVSLGQELSLKLPATLVVDGNTTNALTASLKGSTLADARILGITPYDAARESELLASFTHATSVSYLVDNRLLTGSEGSINGTDGTLYVLRIRKDGVATHLLWLRVSKKNGLDATTALTILASIRFAS